jgi:hypothetical protein
VVRDIKWGFTTRIEGPGQKVWVLPRGFGALDPTSKRTRAPHGFGSGLGALGGRGVTQQLDSQIEDLWIYGQVAK